MRILTFIFLLTLYSCGEDNEKSISHEENNVAPKSIVATTHNDSIKMGDLKIAFYSMDSLKSNFKYYKEQDNLVIKQQKTIQTELERMSKNLENYYISKQKEIQSGKLSENQIIEIQKEFQKKQEDILKYEQNQTAKFQSQMAEKLMKIDTKISQVGKKFSELNGIDILISSGQGGQFNYIHPKMDVTKEFIQFLNENEKDF